MACQCLVAPKMGARVTVMIAIGNSALRPTRKPGAVSVARWVGAKASAADGLRAVQMIMSVTPIASRWLKSGRAIFFNSGSSENGSTAGIRSTFFSASMARMVGNGASSTV